MEEIEKYIAEKYRGSWLKFYHREIKEIIKDYPDAKFINIRHTPGMRPIDISVKEIKSRCFDETDQRLSEVEEKLRGFTNISASQIFTAINIELYRHER